MSATIFMPWKTSQECAAEVSSAVKFRVYVQFPWSHTGVLKLSSYSGSPITPASSRSVIKSPGTLPLMETEPLAFARPHCPFKDCMLEPMMPLLSPEITANAVSAGSKRRARSMVLFTQTRGVCSAIHAAGEGPRGG